MITILEQMMAKSDDSRTAIKELTDAIQARRKATHDKKDTNQMRLEPKTEHQEKMDVWIAHMKDGRKERKACQEVTEAKPEKMEPNPGEKEVIVERKKIPNEAATIHSLRACQEMTEVRLKCKEPTSVDMDSEVEHQEVPTDEATVKSLGTMKKRYKGRHLAAR
jgi:hypothetical protein